MKLPPPIGTLPVDSKFPLENFERMFDESHPRLRDEARKEFAKNCKKHIDDISSKYILKDETADQAILFLPAEAIFAEIHAFHPNVIKYSQSKKVWIASPTTLMAILTTVQSVVRDMERSKYMNVLHREINHLGEEFRRYGERWNNFSKHLMTVTKDADEIHTTTKKIAKKFDRIMDVDFDKKELDSSKAGLI